MLDIREGVVKDKHKKNNVKSIKESIHMYIGMYNSTGSGMPVYTMCNSLFNMIIHMSMLYKFFITENIPFSG